MTDPIEVSGNKTLGAGDDGMIQLVNNAATITLPHEDTHKFVKNDEMTIISNTDSAINIIGEEGVTLTTSASIITKGQSKKVKYLGNNVYLIWSIIIVMIMTYVSNYTTKHIENDIIVIDYGKE